MPRWTFEEAAHLRGVQLAIDTRAQIEKWDVRASRAMVSIPLKSGQRIIDCVGPRKVCPAKKLGMPWAQVTDLTASDQRRVWLAGFKPITLPDKSKYPNHAERKARRQMLESLEMQQSRDKLPRILSTSSLLDELRQGKFEMHGFMYGKK